MSAKLTGKPNFLLMPERFISCLNASARKWAGRKAFANSKTLESGQAMVEFAFAFSVFCLMFIGFVGFAIIFFYWLTTASAAREGARLIVGDPSATYNNVRDRICATSVGFGNSEANCLSQVSSGEMTISIAPTTIPKLSRSQVSVIVRYHVPLPTLRLGLVNGGGWTFLQPIWVENTAVMRIE